MKSTAALLLLGLASCAVATGAELRVPADYATIQAAVDASKTNDIIWIAPGVYKEQALIFSNKLTLIGQPGTILRATEGMLPYPGSPAGHSPILGIGSSDVTVRGLTFEGERLAGNYVGAADLVGLYAVRSSVNVENCAFYGFREVSPGLEGADALWIQSFVDDISARVVGCTFADNYDCVLIIGGDGRQNITATIENNVIIGLGPVDTAISYAGIQLAGGVGGRIAGNTISEFSYVGTTPPFPISFGILTSDSPTFAAVPSLEIEGNTLRNNQMHIALIKADGSVIRNNRFQGTAPGIVPLGMVFSGTNVTVANNQFEDIPEGIRLLGNEPFADTLPGLGDILGFAVNAQVTSNRFCNVTIPIQRQFPATATETGTLTNSCSSPLLIITPASLVSWPDEVDSSTIESAPTVDGPWAALATTPFIQYGRRNIAVPTDDARQFFRLR